MNRISLFTTIGILFFSSGKAFAQAEAKESTPYETSMAFVASSTSDDSIQLKAVINVKHESGATNLANAEVIFMVTGADSAISLGKVKTDLKGTALLKVPARNIYPRNESSLINFKAIFEGSENYEANEGESALKPSRLNVSFYEEDSVRYVKVEGLQYNADGSTSAMGPVDLILSVPKMFSMLKIAEVSLDSTGIGTVEFPSGIIGDSVGNLMVVASLDEHEVFGFVTGNATVNWGLPKHLISPDRPSRELWTPIAPLWMIITLIIMLAGVWGHYVYAIVQLAMIKKSGDKLEKEKVKEKVKEREKEKEKSKKIKE